MIVYSDELRHGIRGWIKSGHKYIKREWHNGRWRYWYRQKPTTPKLSDPNGKVITENIIQEEKLLKMSRSKVLTSRDVLNMKL